MSSFDFRIGWQPCFGSVLLIGTTSETVLQSSLNWAIRWVSPLKQRSAENAPRASGGLLKIMPMGRS